MFLQQLINGITQGSLFALLAISFSIIYGVLKLVNFATGSLYMMGAFAGLMVVKYVTPNIFVALLAGGAMGWFLGFVIEKVAIKALRGVARIASLICTIGFSIFLNELASVIYGAETQSMPSFYNNTAFVIGDVNVVWYQIFMVVTAAVILLFLQIIIFKTKLGLAIRTVSLDYKVAGLMGINVDKTISYAFALGGSTAGIAGVLAAVYYNAVVPTMGNIAGLKSFSAAVFGGLSSIPGAILGGYLLGIIENLGVQVVGSGWRDIIGFVILVGFLLFRPRGILGKKINI
ncbi:MAG: branched-chain amino acid ABC transporter permease [Spirochaetales bacterium]|nr:branched-chain amino acid ABC transporter permease [Spirochaetales bacterium]